MKMCVVTCAKALLAPVALAKCWWAWPKQVNTNSKEYWITYCKKMQKTSVMILLFWNVGGSSCHLCSFSVCDWHSGLNNGTVTEPTAYRLQLQVSSTWTIPHKFFLYYTIIPIRHCGWFAAISVLVLWWASLENHPDSLEYEFNERLHEVRDRFAEIQTALSSNSFSHHKHDHGSFSAHPYGSKLHGVCSRDASFCFYHC